MTLFPENSLRPAGLFAAILGLGIGLLGPGAASAAASGSTPGSAPDTGSAVPLLGAPLGAGGAAGSVGGAGAALPDTVPGISAGEAVQLSAQGAFTTSAPRVGDSLDYVLQVEWKDTQVPVMVLAPDSIVFAGFEILGQAAVHRKTADGREVRNHTDFIYRLRARTPGSGRVSSIKLRYLSGLSRQEEAAYVPSGAIDILPARRRLLDMLWVKLALAVLLLGGAFAAGSAAFRAARRARSRSGPSREDFRPNLKALKGRLKAGDSKALILEMEGICIRHLKQELGESARGDAGDRFDALLTAYRAARLGSARPDKGPEGDAENQDWERLQELFRHARFAGGHKEPHELQEAHRTLRKCLNLTGEEDHD